MTKKGTYQYNYKSLLLKGEIVDQFRKFCKQQRQKQSTVLEAMLHFSQWHGISPFDRFGPQLQREEEKTRKRIDAVIAIIKDIEKNQTKPTTAMLQALFAGIDPIPPKEEPPKKKPIPKNHVPEYKFDRMKEERDDFKHTLSDILDRVVEIEPTFGKPYFKLDITPGALVRIKRTVEKD
jgi:hypothetical protein